jgi:SAM-dependent methyltransferase
MHSLLNSLRKRIYTSRLNSNNHQKNWGGQYWINEGGLRTISCATCPKLAANRLTCMVPFGSPLRKCATAAQEAHLHDLEGKDLLEIGFGKHSIPRRLIKKAGGSWTGLDPMSPKALKAQLGRGGHGHVAAIPFPDNSFDMVVGIQTLEHWEDPSPYGGVQVDYKKCLAEVCRVLKSGGSIYFDAPIYLHGHEMFIAGDIDRIRKLFNGVQWEEVIIETWRERYAPLHRYPTPDRDKRSWRESVSSYPNKLLEDIETNRSAYLIAISAKKS